MRKQFVKTTERALADDARTVLLLGDIGVFGFRQAFAGYPERVYNIGICEQAMLSLAAGMAQEGCLPIIHSIAPFVVERCFEQLKIDLCYQELPARIVSVGASYDYAALGCTHHCPGDVLLLRALPNMQIVVPGTPTEFDQLFRSSLAERQAIYFRLSERANPTSFPVAYGQAHVVRQGRRATVLAVGPMLGPVLEATAALDVTVLYYTTVAPFDAATLREQTPGGNLVIVAPFYVGTLAHDVLQSLTQPVRILSLGVPREFRTNYGTAADHDAACGLTAPRIRAALDDFLRGVA